jgi:hypothetical protein
VRLFTLCASGRFGKQRIGRNGPSASLEGCGLAIFFRSRLIAAMFPEQWALRCPTIIGLTDSEALIPALVVLLIVGPLLWIIGSKWRKWADKKEHERGVALQEALRELGYERREENVAGYIAIVAQFQLGKNRRENLIPHRLQPPAASNGAPQLLDYFWATGYGKSRRAARQTVALVVRAGAGLPRFFLGPEGVFSKIGQALGAQDFDFASHPKFSGMFKLKGDDEAAVRAVFSSGLIEELERNPGITVEGLGDHLIVYREGKSVMPEEIVRFQKDTAAIAQWVLAGRD